MNRILIITKNVSAESYLQEQLHKLNYEVMVSVSIWDIWESSRRVDQFVESFQMIFLSETISDNEAKEFSQKLKSDCLVRIVGEVPSEEDVSEWGDWHISDWVLTSSSLERLREKLVHKTLLYQVQFTKRRQTIKPLYRNQSLTNYKKKAFPLYFADIHFTRLEKEIIHSLMEAKDLSLSRDELCQNWRSKNQNSKLSQLSSSVTKIRKKVIEAYGIEEAVMTLWGVGYQLNNFFYHCLLEGEYRNHSESIHT